MTSRVRILLSIEAVLFGVAALVHAGVLAHGYEHGKAATAESVIGLVLLAGLAVSVAAPHAARAAGLGAQGFALLGTLVGLFTIAIGIGPRTGPDLVFHAGLIVLLVSGLSSIVRRSTREPTSHLPPPTSPST